MSNCGLRISDCGMGSRFKAVNPKSACPDVFARVGAIYNLQSRGFTLLEVMVAVSIMAMVLVTLLGLKNRSMQDVALAERITTASLLAQRVMTDTIVNLKKPIQPLEDEGAFDEEEYKDYAWKKSIVPFEVPVGQIMEVRVAVLWMEGTREETVELVSYE
jgi:general secretion pathway protein I